MNNTKLTDFKRLAVLLTPVRLRRGVMTALMSAFALPFSKIKRSLCAYADGKNKELEITGQTCKLQKLLNDTFDVEERRIRIVDSTLVDIPMVYVYPRGSGNVLFAGGKDSPVFVQLSANTATVATDFYVEVPKDLGLYDNPQLKALVNTYKLAAKRWLIKEI